MLAWLFEFEPPRFVAACVVALQHLALVDSVCYRVRQEGFVRLPASIVALQQMFGVSDLMLQSDQLFD